MRHEQRGFSLIELLIVVAIILIISAIAIPNLLRSREAANQASAIGSLRAISSSEMNYWTTYNSGFTASLLALGPPAGSDPVSSTAAGLVDNFLANGNKSGYVFIYTPSLYDATTNTYSGYYVWANPAVYGQTGGVYYYSDQSFVIRGNANTMASSTDETVAD